MTDAAMNAASESSALNTISATLGDCGNEHLINRVPSKLPDFNVTKQLCTLQADFSKKLAWACAPPSAGPASMSEKAGIAV